MKPFPKHEVASMLLGRATRRVAAKLAGHKEFRFKPSSGLWTDIEELEAWIDIGRVYGGTFNIPQQEYELAAAKATNDREREARALTTLGRVWRRLITISPQPHVRVWLFPAVAKFHHLVNERRPKLLNDELRLFRNTCRKQRIAFEEIWPQTERAFKSSKSRKRGMSRRATRRRSLNG